MYVKMIYLVSLVLVPSLAAITYGIQLGDFENDMDGWSVVDANVAASYSTIGATLNQNSLRISANVGDQNAIVYNLIGQGLVDEFRNNLKVSADITRLVSEWIDVGSSWCDFFLTINAGSSVPVWEYSDTMAEDADWWTNLGDEPMSVIYDYSLALNQIDFDNLEYLELVFVTNWGGFDPGGVYYLDNVQLFGGGPAYDPDPADGARDVSKETSLSWTSGVYADKHDVYFGTNFDDVNDANRANPLNVFVSQDYGLNTYDPGNIVFGENYFWRIDEVNDPNIWKGDVWSFTTAYPSGAYIIGDWEDNLDNWVLYPGSDALLSYSTTGATLNNRSLKLEVPSSFWIIRLNLNAEQLEALKANDLLKMDVTWVTSEWQGHTWSQVHKVAINSGATGWREMIVPVSDTSSPDSPGSWDPSSFGDSDTRTLVWDYSGIDVGSIEEGGWTQINISQNHDSSAGIGTYYFDNARLLNSRLASDPHPANRQTDVQTEPTLSWKPGKYAVTHDVYVGTSFIDVNDVNTVNLASYPNVTHQSVDVNTYEPGVLGLGQDYYWRIDEVNNLNPDSPWVGSVWSFTTGNFLVVDDFESYNDLDPADPNSNRIFNAWIDGYEQPTNGSLVGYENPPFAEQSIVHSGKQSLPFSYDNDMKYSEAQRAISGSQRDWTREGVKELLLWFRGYPPYSGSFVEGPVGTYTMSGSGADIWGNADEFHFTYKELSGPGSIIARVVSVGNTNPWAKAGVMIRETLEPGSKHAFVCVTPNNGVASQGRATTGGDSFNTNQAGITAPHWVKLERDFGGNFTVSHSADGSTWVPVENATTPNIQMSTNAYIGLAVTSNDINATCEAQFSNVSITGNVSQQQWMNQDIGIISNTAEPMYVVLNDNAVIYHDNPDAPLTGEWTEWRIDLQAFANQGVDMAGVNSIGIGIGTKGNTTTSGGSGMMYFDDIRLYRPRDAAAE
ncbi:MAG: hypothetical protein ACYS19_05960 [Planctomycetota bacterium]|jgi:hypothetical protein